MKAFFVVLLSLLGSVTFCFGQKSLLTYDDIKYLLHSNLNQADTFLMAKGYTVTAKNIDKKNRKYKLDIPGGTYSNIDLRSDGKRIFVEIETNELQQYDLIRESISQYLNKDSLVADIQTYTVKNLGTIYITINDTSPYNPIKKDYDIHIVGDKNITADY